MRIRELTIIAVTAGAALTGCTSSGSDTSPYCRELSTAAQRISTSQADLYNGTPAARRSMQRLVGELRSLQAEAPAQIKVVLTELGEAFRSAQDLLQHPRPATSTQLAAVAQTLGRDGRKITDYVTSQCD